LGVDEISQVGGNRGLGMLGREMTVGGLILD
jgi:hypothetical protein